MKFVESFHDFILPKNVLIGSENVWLLQVFWNFRINNWYKEYKYLSPLEDKLKRIKASSHPRHIWAMGQHAFKNVNNQPLLLLTGVQIYNKYLNDVHFFNTSVN